MNLPKAPTHDQPFPLFSHHTNVRHGHNISFVPYWSESSESCSSLFYWFLDSITPWFANPKIHQNFALQVWVFLIIKFLSLLTLCFTSCQMVLRSLPHPVNSSRSSHLCWMETRSWNNQSTGVSTLHRHSSTHWAGPSNSLRCTIGSWHIRSFR